MLFAVCALCLQAACAALPDWENELVNGNKESPRAGVMPAADTQLSLNEEWKFHF